MALLAGALLAADGTTTLRNLPRIADIAGLIEILGCLGVRTTYGADGRSVRIDASSLPEFEAPASLVSRMRGSLQLLG
ncbi:MAG: UDP-N-acetylglucosamine 1-carboxyvinyltransferase, partial [Armatimonadaceae bacterium]